jgi:post-segregation antitoxin (ccd killing protein)
MSDTSRLNPPEHEQAAQQQWYEENKQAVDAYNKLIETSGLFSNGIRMF